MQLNFFMKIILFIPIFFTLCSFSFSYAKPNTSINRTSKQITDRFFLFIITCILIYITGFRSRDGLSFDYGNYESIYYGFKELSWKEAIRSGKGELLFSLLYKACGELTNYNIVAFMFIIAVLTIIPIAVYFYTESQNPWFSILLLVTIGSYWTSFNTARQYLAAAMYISTYKYIQNRKFWRYFFLVLVITMVHFSTIAMLPFYWLLNIRWDFKRKAGKCFLLIILITASVLFCTKTVKRIIPSYYMILDLMQSASVSQLVRPAVVLIFMLLNIRILSLEEKKDAFYFNCCFFYFLIFSMTLSFKIFQRWSYFIVFPTLIAVPNTIHRIKSKDERLFYYFVFIIFSVFYSFETLKNVTYTFFWD